MLTHTMRTRSVAYSLLLRILHKYAGLRLYLNFFKNFNIIIFPTYQGACFADSFIKNKALEKALR